MAQKKGTALHETLVAAVVVGCAACSSAKPEGVPAATDTARAAPEGYGYEFSDDVLKNASAKAAPAPKHNAYRGRLAPETIQSIVRANFGGTAGATRARSRRMQRCKGG